MVPWLAGVVPFGLVIGVSAAQADIPALAGWLTGPLIYAGSSQVATIGMLDARAAPMVVAGGWWFITRSFGGVRPLHSLIDAGLGVT